MTKVLIIEDDITLQEAYSFILKTGGLDVRSAFNGAEGLNIATAEIFDTILLDIHMPVMDGIEFLKRYQAHKPSDTKVIVFSNMVEPEIERKALLLGADQCILKASTTPAMILQLVNN